MRVGENPNKIRNIVAGQIDHFRRLYSGLIEDLPNVIFIRDEVLQVRYLFREGTESICLGSSSICAGTIVTLLQP